MKKYVIILFCMFCFVNAEDIEIQKWNAFVNPRAVAFSSNGKYIAVAHENNNISILDASGRIKVALLKGHFHSINTLTFSADGSLLASAGHDLRVKIWSIKNGADIFTLSNHKAPITCLAFSPNKKILVSGSEDKTIKIWSVSTGTLLKTLPNFKMGISTVSFSEDSSVLYARSHNHEVKLWKINVTGSSNLASEIKNAHYYFLKAKKMLEEDELHKAIELFETSINMDTKQIDANYILARCYSLRSQTYNHTPVGNGHKNIDLQKAISSLKIAIQNGFKDWNKLQTDSALDMIRTEKGYATIAVRFEDGKKDFDSADRRLSFFIKNENGNSAPAYEISVNKKVITKEDTFEVNQNYDVIVKFKEYETLVTSVRIRPGIGPYVIKTPLRKLGKYTFFIRGTHVDIDKIRYAYEILIDGKPVQEHHIEKNKKQVFTYYTFFAEYTAKTIQIVAGYQMVEKRLFQIKGKGVRRLDQISAPLFIKHLNTLGSRGRGPVDAVTAFEKLLKSLYWRKILKKISIDDLLAIFDDVEGWGLHNDRNRLRQRFLLDAINEIIASK